jgi:hypothetical protein
MAGAYGYVVVSTELGEFWAQVAKVASEFKEYCLDAVDQGKVSFDQSDLPIPSSIIERFAISAGLDQTMSERLLGLARDFVGCGGMRSERFALSTGLGQTEPERLLILTRDRARV